MACDRDCDQCAGFDECEEEYFLGAPAEDDEDEEALLDADPIEDQWLDSWMEDHIGGGGYECDSYEFDGD